jgi:hypothetical protein
MEQVRHCSVNDLHRDRDGESGRVVEEVEKLREKLVRERESGCGCRWKDENGMKWDGFRLAVMEQNKNKRATSDHQLINYS